MPTADPLTAIREANDLDVPELVAWVACEAWVPMPMLLMAAVERARELLDPEYVGWYKEKARRARADCWCASQVPV